MDYILGVDGGNTKTDYFLFNTTGQFVDMYRDGTCSHERFIDSFKGTYKAMKKVFDELLTRNNLTPQMIKASVFGLAGNDFLYQHYELVKVVESLGFKNFKIVNDSAISIKIGTTNGYGVCSINGTETSVTGIDINGETLQVGGLGDIVGDEAGGRFLSRQVVRKAFDEIMRFGESTTLTKIVIDLLENSSDRLLMEDIALKFMTDRVDYTVLVKACFDEANKGDKVARDILISMADSLARNVASVVVRLDLGEEPEIVLAGSVYVKGNCPILIEEFKKRVKLYSNKKLKINLLQVPPAIGAIIWAMELANGVYPSIEFRKKIIETVEKTLKNF